MKKSIFILIIEIMIGASLNAIPSSYKNLSTETTATASDIVSGKKHIIQMVL